MNEGQVSVEDLLSASTEAREPAAVVSPVVVTPEWAIGSNGQPVPTLIHFLDDGFTAFGRIWYRGQELEITKEDFPTTQDRFGWTWLEMNKVQQMSRFGKIMWEEGPWPYGDWDNDEAKKAEMKRNRRAS